MSRRGTMAQSSDVTGPSSQQVAGPGLGAGPEQPFCSARLPTVVIPLSNRSESTKSRGGAQSGSGPCCPQKQELGDLGWGAGCWGSGPWMVWSPLDGNGLELRLELCAGGQRVPSLSERV